MPKPPFHSFAFTLIEDKRPRTSLRMTALDNGDYELHVQKGSAANPSSQFTRKVPVETVERLRDALQRAGAFGWEPSYGDNTRPGSRRWTLSIVFEKDVFSLESKGGSDVPGGFNELLEELYRLDFPRTTASGNATKAGGPTSATGLSSAINAMGAGSFGRMSAGDLGAYAATGTGPASDLPGVDFSQIADELKDGLPGLDARDMQDLLAQAQSNPEAIRKRMREEFQHLSASEQERMLDALAATDMATREWWRRFFGI